jgi:hypothetical protein
MKKILKMLIWAAAAAFSLVIVFALLGAIHPVWLGSATTGVANWLVPKKLDTRFHLGKVDLNAYKGSVKLHNFQLDNPKGYDDAEAVKLDYASVEMVPSSVVGDVIHIKEIVLDGVYLSYLSKNGVSNFDAILSKLSDGEESKDDVSGEDEKEKAEKSKKRFMIDKIVISNLKFKYEMLTIPVPVTITLTDIGKDSDGVTMSQALMEILDDLIKTVMRTGNALTDILSLTASSLSTKATNSVSGIMKEAKNLKKGVKELGGSLTDGFKDIKKAFKK